MTAHPRPFRFGIQIRDARDAAGWRDLARRIEDQGYATATMPDHFTEQLAPVPALQAIADATSTLRVGALVFDNDYRHPVVLAKELATMDLLSDGRVEIGLGAGWMRSDYDTSGIPFDRPGVRIDRFVEAIRVVKGAMGDGPFSFEGEHYTITEYDGLPKPVQRPHPPILIGGGGKRVLGIAAREADIVGINGTMTAGAVGPEALETMTRPAVLDRVGIIREAAGDRFDDIELNIRVFMVAVTERPEPMIDDLAKMLEVDPTLVRDSPFSLIGPTSALAEEIVRLREETGISYLIVGQDDVEAFAPVVAALAGT